jgi:RES domain-containing protein
MTPHGDELPQAAAVRAAQHELTATEPTYFVRLSPLKTDPTFDPSDLPVRTISGTFYRQTSPRRSALELDERAPASGRYHVKGQQPRIYASSSEEAAWGELFRHFLGPVSPFEIKRRMSHLTVTDLPVLDLTDLDVCRQLGIPQLELVGNRYRACQLVASLVRRRPDRFGGVLAPSAASEDATTLVVFSEWRDRVHIDHHREIRPPSRMIDLFERLIGTLPLGLQDEALELLRQLRAELRSRLRTPHADPEP